MNMMTGPVFLITGATGYLGRRLVREAGIRGRVYAASREASTSPSVGTPVTLDVAERDAVHRVIDEIQPTVVIHAAAVNPGQGNDEDMWRVNEEGSACIAEAARRVGCRLIAISTDIVHDGSHGPYGDDDPANPINVYGRSKAAGEDAIAAVAPDAAVVRTSLMYGLDEMDRGTAGFAERLHRGEPQVLFADVLRNPIHVDTLATSVLRLAETTYAGTLNIAGRQSLSRETYARRLLAYWGVPTHDLIEVARAADISDSIPLDLRLTVDRAEQLLGIDLAGVDAVLESAAPVARREIGT